ncbi:MAG TPA: 2-amino-4-hydroxy-6-hydroxymethyldihydropteridine diphosphokinase [Candidatus Polarisedimenticolaceae bacterium]|nr:2-amino-4-hydroxy-6-hydroxymethyldihydropteridine diphosphokinase [Candidatus Polarisedimenticolaceae bacterium]
MDACVGLGANLGDRGRQLEFGLAGLERAGLGPLACSAVWETEPVDGAAPPWFWNMAVRFPTPLAPLELLERLQAIERAAGRRPGPRNAPRELDLDLLLLDGLVVDDPRLTLPHPRMWQRRFVLEPLAEIAPEQRDPASGRTVAEICDELRARPERVRRLGPLAARAAVPL